MTDPRPNLIYILADDLGYADLGCMGARDVNNQPADISPNLDLMAAQGIRFTHGYANSSVCSPTRFALITGRWQYRLRGAAEEPLASQVGDKVLGLPPNHPTLPSLLSEAGYRTALIGKWHLGHPPAFGPRLSGYQEHYGYYSGGIDYFAHTGPFGNHDFYLNEQPIHPDGYLTDLLNRRAVNFIENHDTSQPFLLSLHHCAPHWPWLTRDDRAESERTRQRLWHTDGGSTMTYQRMIQQLDEGIGWVLDALERRGLADNTLVVFTSDNGGERYSNNWPFVGQKMDLLEGGIRVPLIARWPTRIRAGRVSTCASLTMDWTATMLAAAGVPQHPDYPLDGIDLSPVFSDESWQRQGDLCWRMKHREQRALIRGRWKYLTLENHEYLFDLEVDPRERANLAQREPARLAELRQAWDAWNAQMPPIPEDARVYQLFKPGDKATTTL